jgi:hypothetical protein
MSKPVWRLLLGLSAAVAVGGCVWNKPSSGGRSPLRPVQMSPDSVALDMFTVRFPVDEAEINGRLWEEIDEQHFPPQLRNLLRQYGFRVGVVAAPIPTELSRLLELTEAPPPTELGAHAVDLQSESTVLRRHLQLPARSPGQIVSSDFYDNLPVFCRDPGTGEVSGGTLKSAQCIFAVRACPEPDGRVRVELVPEVHHGQAKRRFARENGVIRFNTERPKRSFDELTITAVLAPGQMIVLSSLPDRPGSLGHHFLTEDSSGEVEQKLLVIRLSQTQHDPLFSDDGLPPPEPELSL